MNLPLIQGEDNTCNAILGDPVHLCGADDDLKGKQVGGSKGEDRGVQSLRVARQTFNTASYGQTWGAYVISNLTRCEQIISSAQKLHPHGGFMMLT